MYSEDDLLPISALQHLAYCPRQCALIHIERVWAENRFTAEGNLLHRRADSLTRESRGRLHVARSLRLHSYRLGLAGIADVVEFHEVADEETGVALKGLNGRWMVVPVEYKRGRPKESDCDEVQLCAQALCLEEMMNAAINEGFLYYGKTHRRRSVSFDDTLRQRTEDLAAELHRLFDSAKTPPPEHGPKCENCSLKEQCLPEAGRRSAESYLRRMLDAAAEDSS